MIESLRAFAMLVAVLEEGSFQAAGNRLNVSASVVSHNIKLLEERFDCILLDRSSRVLKATPDGARLLAPARKMVDAANFGLDTLGADALEQTGRIVLFVPHMLSGGVLGNIIEDFLLAHPKVQMDLRFENVQRHPIHDDVDLIIGIKRLDHKSVGQRDLFGGGGGFYCAPDLAERVERIKPREVLFKIPLLMCHGFGSQEWARAFLSETHTFMNDIPFRMKCDDVSILYRMCLSGAGLAVLPHSLVSQDVKRGRFVQVLKHLSLEHTHFLASWNTDSANVALVESFLDHTEVVLKRLRRLSA